MMNNLRAGPRQPVKDKMSREMREKMKKIQLEEKIKIETDIRRAQMAKVAEMANQKKTKKEVKKEAPVMESSEGKIQITI